MTSSYVGDLITAAGARIHKILEDRISVYCPFHKGGQERKASMSVYTASRRVKCFTCGYSKFVDQFLIDLGMNKEVVRDLTANLKTLTPARTEITNEGPDYKQRAQLAAWVGAFRSNLPRNLLEAGFTQEILQHYEVGYDPRYSRVTYPVHDRYGNLVAVVGGSIQKGDPVKYKLYDEEVGISKQTSQRHRDHLWGFHKMEVGGPYVLVEGYKAAMWVRQCGFPVAATQGVQYTEHQIGVITGHFRPVLVMFDNDSAGVSAQERIMRQLLPLMGSNVRSITYPRPDAKQPDDLSVEEVVNTLRSYYDEG